MNAAYRAKTGSPTRKAVLVALANQADQDGKCWPSIEYIADRTEISERTVIRCLEDLCGMGFVRKQIRAGDGGGRKSNLYTFQFDRMRGAKCHGDTLGKVTLCQGQSDTGAGQSDTVTPEQSITINKQSIKDFAQAHDALAECEDWLTVLRKKKAATTPEAWKRRLATARKLVEQGHPLKTVFARSADAGWTGLFEVKDGHNGKRETAIERADRREREELARAGVTLGF